MLFHHNGCFNADVCKTNGCSYCIHYYATAASNYYEYAIYRLSPPLWIKSVTAKQCNNKYIYTPLLSISFIGSELVVLSSIFRRHEHPSFKTKHIPVKFVGNRISEFTESVFYSYLPSASTVIWNKHLVNNGSGSSLK